MKIIVKSQSRPCGSCNVCCQGHLVAEIFKGVEIRPGKACAFLSGGCRIYQIRPHVCRQFECEWKRNSNIPEWLKPDEAGGAVITRRQILDYNYLVIVGGVKPVLSKVHEWADAYSKMDTNNHVVIIGDPMQAYSQDPKFAYMVGVKEYGV